MATTQIRNAQIKDNTIEVGKLVDNFLAGANWDISGGAADATITGLAPGVNPTDAVNFSQLAAATQQNCDTEEFDVAADGEVFTLAQTPMAGLKNLHVFLNGLRLSSNEYTIAGADVTVTSPTVEIGDCVVVDYRY